MKKKYPISDLMKNSFYHRSRPSENLYERVDSDFRVIDGEIIKPWRKKRWLWLIISIIALVGAGFLFTFITNNSYSFREIPGYENRARYTNKDQGYSINYPPEFKYVDERTSKKVAIGDGIVPKILIESFYTEYTGNLKDWAMIHLDKTYSEIFNIDEDVIRTEKTIGSLNLVEASYGEISDGYNGKRVLSYIQNGKQIVFLQALSNYKDFTQSEFQKKLLGSFQILVTERSEYRGLSAEELLQKYFVALSKFDYHEQYRLQNLDVNETEYQKIADKRYTGVENFVFSTPQNIGNDEYEYYVILFNPDSTEILRVKKQVKNSKITHLENEYLTADELVKLLEKDSFLNKEENWSEGFEMEEMINTTKGRDFEIINVYPNTVSVSNGSYRVRLDVEIKNNGPAKYNKDSGSNKIPYLHCAIGENLDQMKNSTQSCKSRFSRGIDNDVKPCNRGGNNPKISTLAVGNDFTMQIYSDLNNFSENVVVGCLLNYSNSADPESIYRNNYIQKTISLKERVNAWGYGFDG